MTDVEHHIATGGHLIVDRYSQERYRIDLDTYQRIIEMIRFYNESIYALPDDEVIEATGADDQNGGRRVRLRVNQIVFV